MVDEAVRERIENFISAVRQRGIPISRIVLFGSHARGDAHEWSDIDIVVISPLFDGPDLRSAVDMLWEATVSTRGHIEPVACGERRWDDDDGSPILEIARREGVEIPLPAP